MRFEPRAIVAGLLGAAVSLLAACGGGAGLLSNDQSSTLNSQLNAVSSAVYSGNCNLATSAVTNFNHEIANLPRSVDTTLQANLESGASTLATLASRDCRTNSTTTRATSSTTSSPSTSTTTAVTPSSTSTTTSTTTTPTSTTTTPITTSSITSATSSAAPGTSSTGSGSGGAGLGGGPGGGNSGGVGTSNGRGSGQ